jgi:hydrogenase maturation protease
MTRGGAAGSVYVLAVESVDPAVEVDLHLAVPARALAVAKALGGLPREVFLVGCEPADVDELTTRLTPSVEAAVETALGHVRLLARRARPGRSRISSVATRSCRSCSGAGRSGA